LTPEILDESDDVRIIWRNAGQSLSVSERIEAEGLFHLERGELAVGAFPSLRKKRERRARSCDNDYNPGLRRHCCISLRRASNDTRSASAFLRQAGTLCSTTLTAIARAGYGAAGTGQG
jgi:hypothetical protein